MTTSSGGVRAFVVAGLVASGIGCGFYGYEDRGEPLCAGDCANAQDAATVAPVDCSDRSCRRVFVTRSAPASGAFGGLAGADAFCQASAEAQGIGGTYRAWLSDSTESPSTRFATANVPYRLLDGTIVAVDWADLVDHSLAHPIDMHEDGSTRPANETREVWTGTDWDGSKLAASCAGWTSGSSSETGAAGRTNSGSTWSAVAERSCDRADLSFYCFEQ